MNRRDEAKLDDDLRKLDEILAWVLEAQHALAEIAVEFRKAGVTQQFGVFYDRVAKLLPDWAVTE